MSSQEEPELTLANLPMDIIQRIVQMEDPHSGSFASKGLISRRWHAYTQRARDTVDVDLLCLFFGRSSMPKSTFVRRSFRSPRMMLGTQVWGVAKARKVIPRCSRIKVLDMCSPKVIDSKVFTTVRQFIGEILIDTLAITFLEIFVDNYRSPIIDFMKKNAIKHFHLEANNIDEHALGAFIKDAMQTIRSIEICGKRVKGHEYFGRPKECWEIFIQELNSTGIVHAQFFPEDESGKRENESHLRFRIQNLTSHSRKRPFAEELIYGKNNEEIIAPEKIQILQ